MTPTDDDRRRQPRRDVTLFLCQGGEEDLYLGIARNIAGGGLFVETEERLPVGAIQQVTFTCRGQLCSCKTRVIRHDTDGMALEFTEEDPEAEAAVRALLGG